MRLGKRRGWMLALALAGAVVAGWSGSARAIGIRLHRIPRETPALDYRTGTVMVAPPIPYGEYAKDYAGAVHEGIGLAAGAVHGAAAHVAGTAHALLGKICGHCGDGACGLCGGVEEMSDSAPCGGCGGDGCPRCDCRGRNLIVDGSGLGDPGVAGPGFGGSDGFGAGGRSLGHGRSGLGSKRDGRVVQSGLFSGSGSGVLCGPGQSCVTRKAAR